jgi:hypothetical protein
MRMPSTSEQEALIACLARKSSKLAKIYRGGLAVFLDEGNPLRFELAAHAMRELIEKSPLLINEEVVVTGDTMKNRLEGVRRAYQMLTQGHGFNEKSPVSGAEDQVRAVILELSRYFEWEADNRPQARQRTARMLAALSGPGQALPVDVSDNEVARWMEADGYFKMVAHNRSDSVDRNEFVARMTYIERVLLRRLQPPGVPELDELDALIEEGESDH